MKYENDCYNLYVNNNYNVNVLKNLKRIMFVINGIDEFKNKLSSENQEKLNEFFTKTKDMNVINFIIIDSIDKIKKVEYENWFKECFNSSEGIWIGDGINDQFTLKVTIRTDEVRETIEDDFCFVIKRGKPVLVKYVSDFTISNSSESLNFD